MSPDRNGQTKMSQDRNGPDRIGSDQIAQTESARPNRPDRIGQAEKSRTPHFTSEMALMFCINSTITRIQNQICEKSNTYKAKHAQDPIKFKHVRHVVHEKLSNSSHH